MEVLRVATTDPRRHRPSGARSRRWTIALAVAALWAMAVPYLAAAVGLRLDVPRSVEVVDHVVPGVVTLGAAAMLAARSRRGRPAALGDVAWSVAAGATTLAGFWIVATHVPLLAEALDGVTPWGGALLHLSAGLPVLGAGGLMLLAPLRSAD